MSDALLRAVPLLERDVAQTVGASYRPAVAEAAANLAAYGAGDGVRLVETVQQELHDTFVDTTWPACPRHRSHPLWYREDGRWWCEPDGVAVCRLGDLAESRGDR